MPFYRRIQVLVALLATASIASAQFLGPAPVAWRWAQPTSVAPGGSIAVEGDTLYAAVGSRVYAVDRESGNQRWRYPAAEPLEGSFRYGATISEGVVVAAADNKLIYGIDAANGQSKWEYPLTENLIGPPVIVGKYTVFALSDNSIMAIYTADGKPAWKNPQRIFDGIMGNVSGTRDTVLVVTQNYELWSVNLATQNADWKVRMSTVGSDVRPVFYADTIYLNSGQYLVALNSRGGKRFEANVGASLVRNPAVAAEGVAVVDIDGKVYTYDLNGRPIMRRPADLGSVPVTDPAVLGNFAAVTTSNGSLNLVDLKTGALAWNYIVRPQNPPQPGTNAPNYVAAASVPLLVGQTLYLTGRDGSILAFDRQLGVDLTPPTVRMAFPNAGDQFSGQPPLEMAFQIRDEASGVNELSVKADIDGQEAESEYTRDGWLTIKITTAGKNKPLSNGRKVITVTVSDWMGNTAKVPFTVMIDNALKPAGRIRTQDQGGTGLPGGAPGGGRGAAGDI